jgi:hypothetical protein
MANDDESWGWIAFWFLATFFVGAVFPPLGLFSLGLAIYYGGKRLFK